MRGSYCRGSCENVASYMLMPHAYFYITHIEISQKQKKCLSHLPVGLLDFMSGEGTLGGEKERCPSSLLNASLCGDSPRSWPTSHPREAKQGQPHGLTQHSCPQDSIPSLQCSGGTHSARAQYSLVNAGWQALPLQGRAHEPS